MGMNGTRQTNEDSFLPIIGKLVLTVADVEGAAGELIVLKTSRDALPPAWAQSGQQLIRTLMTCYDHDNFQAMCADMLTLLPQRNLVMHGEWMFLDPVSDVAWVMNRKHKKGTDPAPSYDWASITVSDLQRLVAAYQRVLEGLSGYIGDVMGLQVHGTG